MEALIRGSSLKETDSLTHSLEGESLSTYASSMQRVKVFVLERSFLIDRSF
jgi:hypothetical protein